MKARMCRVYSGDDLGIKTDSVRISRSSSTSPPRPELLDDMQQCFSKLASIVPTVHHNERVSKVQLLQHVIDYITDLEVTLQYKPSSSPSGLLLAGSETPRRRPLSENTYLTNMVSACLHLLVFLVNVHFVLDTKQTSTF